MKTFIIDVAIACALVTVGLVPAISAAQASQQTSQVAAIAADNYQG